MAGKKNKLARPGSNASRTGSSPFGSSPAGNAPPTGLPAQTNTQITTKKTKRNQKKAKKPTGGSDADGGKAARSGQADSKKDIEDEPVSKDSYKENRMNHTGSSGITLDAEKSPEKPIRSEPFIVNGIDRRSRESQMSGSQANNYANSIDSIQGHGSAQLRNPGLHPLGFPYVFSASDQFSATEPYWSNLPAGLPARSNNYHTRSLSYKASHSSFSPASPDSRQNNFVGHCATQQPPPAYFSQEVITFGGHIDSEGSSPRRPNPAELHSRSGVPFSTYLIPHTHGGPAYSAAPGWNGYTNPFHGSRESGQFAPGGYPAVTRDAYGQPLYMPPYGYAYRPTNSIPSPPHQEYDPYLSAGATAHYGNGNLPGHHPSRSINLDTAQQYYPEEPFVEQPQPISSVGSVVSGHNSEGQSVPGDTTITNYEAAPAEVSANPGSIAESMSNFDASAIPHQATPMGTCDLTPGAGRVLKGESRPGCIEDLNRLQGLPDQLLDAFQIGDWADYQMVLESATGNFLPITFPIHAVVVSRSPRLKALLKTPYAAASRIIRVVTENSFNQPAAVETCLRHLYGLPLLNEHQLARLPPLSAGFQETNNLAMMTSVDKIHQMDLALCYTVTGDFLSMPEITNRGFELAKNLIHWDTLERVINFGLAPQNFAIEPFREKAATPSSIAQSTGDREDEVESSTLKSDSFYMGTAGKLMVTAFEFIVRNLPPNFRLDTEAHVSQMPDRISCNPEDLRGTVLSNPNLASVKFGDFESLNDRKPSYESTVISTILLALPFGYLSELFAVMKAKSILTRKLADGVVTERERRRMRVLRARKFKGEAKGNQVEAGGTNALGWEESIKGCVNDKGDKVILTRAWTGLDYLGSAKRGSSRISGSRGSSSSHNF